MKRIFDLFLSLFILLALSPLLGLIALLLIIFNKRPVIFSQYRVGKEGKPFKIYKFRTMKQNVPDLRNPDGTTYNGRDDPRLTRIGRFLRETSLDELPQLVNILKGDMSFVGPRPCQIDQISLFSSEERLILDKIRPGITGLAQIKGRNRLSLKERIFWDLEYTRKILNSKFKILNLLFDLLIIVKTILMVVKREGIYVKI